MATISIPRPDDFLKDFVRSLARKAGLCAAGWLVVYFATQFMRGEDAGAWALFAPMVGAAAGLTIGWWLAEDAVERAGFSGFALWAMLVVASWVAIWGVEGLMHLILRWPVGFGGWMMVSSATLLAMASAVWRASADD